MTRRIHSFIWGGLAAAIFIGLGAFVAINENDDFTEIFATFGAIALMAFTLVSCLILNNNFIIKIISFIFWHGYVPDLYSDDCGIIWLLTFRLLYWVLRYTITTLCILFVSFIFLFVSIYVYPFSIYRNIKYYD